MDLINTLQTALGPGFRLERELTPGGMSRVFLARDLSLDRDIVVKVLPAEETHGTNGERFRSEIQLIARLQHPLVVPVLAAGSAGDALWYAMPFMRGESLRALLTREQRLPIAEAVRIAREVLDALAFAHEQGVVHRDIKPENVLLDAGHAIVADFGIAKALRASGFATTAGIALGTPTYMAPEQAVADPSVDHRADLYAVGVLLHEMLAGTPPFSGTAQQVVAAHLTAAPPALRTLRDEVPAALEAVVLQALAKDAEARPALAKAMSDALQQATVSSPAALAPAASPARRRLVAGIAAVAVLGIGAAGSRSRQHREREPRRCRRDPDGRRRGKPRAVQRPTTATLRR
jgi:serine/threonine protein kinase